MVNSEDNINFVVKKDLSYVKEKTRETTQQ